MARLTGTYECLQRIAELLQEEGVESRYVAILQNHGPDFAPLVSIDLQAFKAIFFGQAVTARQDGSCTTFSANKYGVMWQSSEYQLPARPVVTQVKL